MKRILILVVVTVFCLVAVAFGTDPAAVPAVAAPSPSLVQWLMSNSTAVFGVALAISEFLALIPGFQGNGILDAIIKALTVLSKKQDGQ